MATFIKVEQDGSELLRRNQEQAQAARLAKLEGDEQARTEKEAKRQRQAELQRRGLDASGNALGDSRRRQPFRRDEPAASFLLNQTTPGHLWWFVQSEEVTDTGVLAQAAPGFASNQAYVGTVRLGYKRTSRLYCGDGSKYVEIVHGQTPQAMLTPFSGFPGVTDPPQSTRATVYWYEAFGNVGNDGAQVFILPAGRDLFIAVFFAWNYQVTISTSLPVIGEGTNAVRCGSPAVGTPYPRPDNPNFFYAPLSSFTKAEQKSKIIRTFICSNTNIREISPPGSLASLLQLLLPDPIDRPERFGTGVILNTQTATQIVADSTIPQFSFNWSIKGTGMGFLNALNHSPAVYDYACNETDASGNLLPIAQAWRQRIGAVVKPLPPRLRWLVEDTATGAYRKPYTDAPIQNLFNSGQPFNYGQWRIPNEQPSYFVGPSGEYYDPASYVPQPRRTMIMSPGRPTLTPQPIINNYPGFGEFLSKVWDFDDPNYCRAVCLALGFTDTDLVP